jgi:hypothetical protein
MEVKMNAVKKIVSMSWFISLVIFVLSPIAPVFASNEEVRMIFDQIGEAPKVFGNYRPVDKGKKVYSDVTLVPYSSKPPPAPPQHDLLRAGSAESETQS